MGTNHPQALLVSRSIQCEAMPRLYASLQLLLRLVCGRAEEVQHTAAAQGRHAELSEGLEGAPHQVPHRTDSLRNHPPQPHL